MALGSATLLLAFALTSCRAGALAREKPCIVGEATMRADSSLSLWLRADEPDGPSGHATFMYRPGEPNYESILEHVGPLAPGERKLVPCWPDD